MPSGLDVTFVFDAILDVPVFGAVMEEEQCGCERIWLTWMLTCLIFFWAVSFRNERPASRPFCIDALNASAMALCFCFQKRVKGKSAIQYRQMCFSLTFSFRPHTMHRRGSRRSAMAIRSPLMRSFISVANKNVSCSAAVWSAACLGRDAMPLVLSRQSPDVASALPQSKP